MFKFLFFIFFFFILLVLLMGFSVLRTFKRLLFGSGKKNEYTQSNRKSSSGQQRKNTYNEPPQRKKIITKDEGEYVDYEEVK